MFKCFFLSFLMAFSVLGSGKGGKLPKSTVTAEAASSGAVGSSDVDEKKFKTGSVLNRIQAAATGGTSGGEPESILKEAKRAWKRQGADKALGKICPSLHKARTDPSIVGLGLPSLAFKDLSNPVHTADFIGNLRFYINGLLKPKKANELTRNRIWLKMGHFILGSSSSKDSVGIEDLKYMEENFPQYKGRVFLGESFGVGSGNDIFNIINKLSYCGDKKECDWKQAPSRPMKGFSMRACKMAKADSCANFKTFLEKVRGCKLEDVKGCILYATALGGEEKQKGGYYAILKQAYEGLKGGSDSAGVQKKGKGVKKEKKSPKAKGKKADKGAAADSVEASESVNADTADSSETFTKEEALEEFADVKNFADADTFASDKTVQRNFIGAIVLVELLKRQALAEGGKSSSKVLKANMKEILADAAKVLAKMKIASEENQGSLGKMGGKLFGGFVRDAQTALKEAMQEAEKNKLDKKAAKGSGGASEKTAKGGGKKGKSK